MNAAIDAHFPNRKKSNQPKTAKKDDHISIQNANGSQQTALKVKGNEKICQLFQQTHDDERTDGEKPCGSVHLFNSSVDAFFSLSIYIFLSFWLLQR